MAEPPEGIDWQKWLKSGVDNTVKSVVAVN